MRARASTPPPLHGPPGTLTPPCLPMLPQLGPQAGSPHIPHPSETQPISSLLVTRGSQPSQPSVGCTLRRLCSALSPSRVFLVLRAQLQNCLLSAAAPSAIRKGLLHPLSSHSTFCLQREASFLPCVCIGSIRGLGCIWTSCARRASVDQCCPWGGVTLPAPCKQPASPGMGLWAVLQGLAICRVSHPGVHSAANTAFWNLTSQATSACLE